MVYLLKSMDFYVMSASKVKLKVVRAAEPNQYFRHSIDVLKAKWYQLHDEDNDEELEEIDMFLEKKVAKYTVKDNIGSIWEITTITLEN